MKLFKRHTPGKHDVTSDTRRGLVDWLNMEEIFPPNDPKLRTIKQFYQNFKTRDFQHIPKLLTNDVEFTINGRAGTVPLAGSYRGKEAIKTYLKGFCDSISQGQITFQFNLVDGDMVNTHVQIVAKVPSSGKSFDLEFVYNWTLNNEGKIKSLFLYYDTNSWYQAFQAGGADHIEDLKGNMNFTVKKLSFDPLQSLKDTYDAFNRGAIPEILEKLDDQFLFILKGDPGIPFEGIYRGKDGFLRFLNNLKGAATYTGVPVNKFFVVQGNRIDAHVVEELKCLATGKLFRAEIVQAWIISDDNKLLEFKSYNDQYEVVEAFKP
ncbi:MAG: nuclear transport factor 2 family protein [Firmicutes bacterium]|nr:nuclear transport factor 2 family protein [Bacillota bacterium]